MPSLAPDLRAFLAVSDGSPWTRFPRCGFQLHPLTGMLSLRALPVDIVGGPRGWDPFPD